MAISAQATGSASAAKKPAFQQSKPLPVPNSDFYQLADVLTPEEKAIVKKVRTYMETKVQPVINKYWSDDAFPFLEMPREGHGPRVRPRLVRRALCRGTRAADERPAALDRGGDGDDARGPDRRDDPAALGIAWRRRSISS